MILLLLIPTILGELILHNQTIHKKIIKESYPVEWTQGFISPTKWPQIIIMGSSLARGSINPKLLTKNLSQPGTTGNAGSIAIPSDSLSNDYFTLYRILYTCTTCPKKIVLVVTDISLKSHEMTGWVDFSKARIKQNYIDDQSSKRILEVASRLDPGYKKISEEIQREKIFRLRFMSRNIITASQRKLYSYISHGISSSKGLVKTQIETDIGYGYFPYDIKVTNYPTNSINNYREYLGKYEVGGSGGFFLSSFLDLAKKHDVQIYLVLPPLTDYYQNAFKKYLLEYENFVIKTGREKNVPVINAMKLMSEKHELFSDSNHLNKYGADIFTPYLEKIITQH